MIAAESSPFLLHDAPINPDWIIYGAPRARAKQENSGELSQGFWDCTDGSFDWYYGGAESIYILKGSAMVRNREPRSPWVTLGPCDTFTFPSGSVFEWRIREYVYKHFVIAPAPSILKRALRKLRA